MLVGGSGLSLWLDWHWARSLLLNPFFHLLTLVAGLRQTRSLSVCVKGHDFLCPFCFRIVDFQKSAKELNGKI